MNFENTLVQLLALARAQATKPGGTPARLHRGLPSRWERDRLRPRCIFRFPGELIAHRHASAR